MKKYIILFLFTIQLLVAQGSSSGVNIDLMGGMGLTYVSTPAFNDYVNNLVPQQDEVESFASSICFFLETDYSINKTFDIGIEYENRLYSLTSNISGLDIYEIDYTVHSPTLLAYYVIQGEGYKFKFGGGGGYRYLSLTEKLPSTRAKENFNASGFGVLLKAHGHTLLGGSFYAYIGADLRYDIIGEASSNGNVFNSPALNSEINFNSLGIGAKLGVSYFIR